MTSAAITNGWNEWRAPHASNTNEKYVETGVAPSEDLARVLLERLVARSSNPSGFDRAALKTLNRDAWGTEGD
jgi:hypothetical protein